MKIGKSPSTRNKEGTLDKRDKLMSRYDFKLGEN